MNSDQCAVGQMDKTSRVARALRRSSWLRVVVSRRLAAAVAAAGVGVIIGGCAIWDIGPEPDRYVGRTGHEPQRLTDANLEAVTPVAPGDQSGGAATLPGATMPAATQATTQHAMIEPAPDVYKPLMRGRGVDLEVPDAVSVQDAILVALRNNTALRVERYNVPISRTAEELQLSQFDPTVNYSLQGGRTQEGTTVITTQPAFLATPGVRITDTVAGSASVTEILPTGTSITAGLTTSNNFYSESSEALGANLTVTQALLRGQGLDVNLATLREAQLDTKVTQYELRGVAETLVADIELDYWDLAYAERQMAIVQNALEVAQKQLDDTNTRIRVGGLAASERPAAEAEVALRRENLIDARSALEKARMAFLQLLAPAQRQFWDKNVTLTTLPFIPIGTMDPPDAHIAVALRMRPDVNQTKLQIQRGDLEIVRTKNGLLPRLDLFLTLGKTTLASDFGGSITNIDGPDYTALLGVKGDWEPVNRAAKASYRSAQLSADKLRETMDNLDQTVQLDVRTQYIEARRTRDQIDATRATREAQEETLRSQEGNLVAGRGTTLDVAIAQRDLLSAQLSEVQAVTNHLKALVTLYRLEGSLLLRRGLDAPGATPVDDGMGRQGPTGMSIRELP